MLAFLLVACTLGGAGDLRPVILDSDAPAESDTEAPVDSDPTEPPGPTASLLMINEFLASNVTGLQDETGARPDWVELYNAGDADVSLAGYALIDSLDDGGGDDAADLDAALVVPAGGWLILYPDDGDVNAASHLPFALAADGGELALFLDGEPVDLLRYGPQASDWSAARAPDAGATWIIDTTPTPGAANDVD